MWAIVLGGLKAVGSFLVGLADAAFKWLGVIFAYRLGIRRERQKTSENANEIKDKQLDLAAKPALHRSDIIARMLKRKRN